MSIQSNELRIGNYYNIGGVDKKLTKELLVWYLEGGSDMFKPIPLTEERLLKFLKYKKTKVISGAYSECYKDDGLFSVNINTMGQFVCRWDGRMLRTIEYVHQLQNLYFALHEEELTFKEICQNI